MAFCPNCGNEVKESARFCSKCGNAIGGNLNILFSPENAAPDNHEATEILIENVETPAPVVPEVKEEVTNEAVVDPFAAFMAAASAPASDDATEILIDEAPIAEPEVSEVAQEVVEQAAEEVTEEITEEAVEEVTEPLVTEQVQEVEEDATELLTQEVIAEPVPIMDEATELLINEPQMPAPSVDDATEILLDNTAMPLPAEEATEILIDEPAYIPPVPLQTNGEDYSFAQPVRNNNTNEEPAIQTTKKKKKKSKAPIVILVILIILALIGGGLFFCYTQGWLDEPIEKITGLINGDSDGDEAEESEEEELSLDDISLGDIADQKYTGEEVKLSLNLKLGDEKLEEGKDYDIKYENNIEVGTATVTITGKGDIKGSTSGQFRIIYGSAILDDAANAEAVKYVSGLYMAFYGRTPSVAELEGDISRIKTSGFVLEDYIGSFFSNSEYLNMVDNITLTEDSSVNEYLVRNVVYRGILGHDPDADGLANWTNAADGAGVEAVAMTILSDADVNASIRAKLGV